MARVTVESASPAACRWPICHASSDRSLTARYLTRASLGGTYLDDRHSEQFVVGGREALDDGDLGVLPDVDDQPRERGTGADVMVDDDRPRERPCGPES